ncbi:hypothetical protein BEWA_018020 [Theileria equi strain WA]|uniref:snRNA-activating protein complex subunit 3 n=1 Tax=Theileria equi strain WA TaxID=1537102 RepID=L0AVC6_THEEQ|nr:hypothetical protein BEWA_018020 [Theileria equi strain WA]AFZ78961.1 hypothetical protein BEWA_018020 [Theileria equi strain WA]|eukprot:XP_004828627.1 hypothetical protein BEWA_018020 [Theileria equi strain WA]
MSGRIRGKHYYTGYLEISSVGIADILPINSIICINKTEKTQKQKIRRITSAVNTSNSDHTIAQNKIDTNLKEGFPGLTVDVYSYEDKYEKLMYRLRRLNKRAERLNTTKTPLSIQLDSSDAEKIAKLRINSNLNTILQRKLRIPRVLEFIDAALQVNLNYLEGNFKKVGILSDYKNNPWSEENLYEYFSECVQLESYQLICGKIRYTNVDLSKYEPLPEFLQLDGPKCNTNPVDIHKKISEQFLKGNEETNIELVNENEIIITISFYHHMRGHKFREFDVLASQTLSDITDTFNCSSIISGDRTLKLKGSCYMINGTLYPDLRNGACDYSVNLVEFYESYKPGVLKSITPINQSDAVLGDIKLPVYTPGYFIHHGECEHRIMITKIRTFDKSRDCPYVSCYPVHIFVSRKHTKDCQICDLNKVDKTVFNSQLLPNNPAYMCNECFKHMNSIKLKTGLYFSKGLVSSTSIDYNEE